jgi:putative protease
MHLGKLATTPFYLDQLEVDPALAGYAVAPSTLNDLRRQAVERLIELRHRLHAGRQPARPGALEQWRAGHGTCRAAGPQSVATLSVLCRSLEQVEAVAGFSNLARIYVDLEDPRLLREVRRLIPARGGPAFAPATLRIHKPGERGFLKLVLESNPDALLIRHLAGWHEAQRTCPSIPRIADHTLNVANDLTADLLLRRAKFDLLTPSYDLNMDQLGTLLARSDPAAFEVTIHQHMPMFHMEHCVFCRFLSTGTDYRDCGRPCEKHEVRLRDRLGYEHPVRADAGCRNTVYNATAQSASAYLPRLLELGVRAFRVDLVQESGAEARELVEAYQGALRGEREAGDLWRKLRASSKLGVTRGTLDHD